MADPDLFQVISILITLAALFNFANYKWLKLPTTIGIMGLALVLSVIVILIGQYEKSLSRCSISILTRIKLLYLRPIRPWPSRSRPKTRQFGSARGNITRFSTS